MPSSNMLRLYATTQIWVFQRGFFQSGAKMVGMQWFILNIEGISNDIHGCLNSPQIPVMLILCCVSLEHVADWSRL